MEEVQPSAVTLYTLEEAAKQLRISRATLYRLVSEKKVPYRKIRPGLAPVFTPQDLGEILEQARKPAVA